MSSQSPDLNITEPLWDFFENKVRVWFYIFTYTIWTLDRSAAGLAANSLKLCSRLLFVSLTTDTMCYSQRSNFLLIKILHAFTWFLVLLSYTCMYVCNVRAIKFRRVISLPCIYHSVTSSTWKVSNWGSITEQQPFLGNKHKKWDLPQVGVSVASNPHHSVFLSSRHQSCVGSPQVIVSSPSLRSHKSGSSRVDVASCRSLQFPRYKIVR